MTQTLTDASMTQSEVAAFVARLRLAGFKVLTLEAGHCVEVDGRQLFRATAMGNERFAVRYCERTFPDV